MASWWFVLGGAATGAALSIVAVRRSPARFQEVVDILRAERLEVGKLVAEVLRVTATLFLELLFTPLRSLRGREHVVPVPEVGGWMKIWARLFFRGYMLEAFEASQLDINDDIYQARSDVERWWFVMRGRYYLFALFFAKPVLTLLGKLREVFSIPQPPGSA